MTGQHRHSLLLSAAAALLVVGCEQADPPEFHLNMVLATSNQVSEPYQQEIADVLGALFGTPDEPLAPADSGLDQKKLTLAAGAAWSDDGGVSHGLYRKHCVHCHGISGDGRGPTARFVNPYPRDYRRGLFKFKSTYNPAKPTDADLHRVLFEGIPGTSMPSFSLLPAIEVEALVEYVKYLSLRGEMEIRLTEFVASELGEEEAEDDDGNPIVDAAGNPKLVRPPLDPSKDADQATAITDALAEIVALWQEAPEQVIVPIEEQIPQDDRSPEEIAESVNLGRALFFGAKANCVKCHGPTALGDGQTTDFDDWAKAQHEFVLAIQRDAASIKRREDAPAPEGESDKDRDERIRQLDEERASLAERQAVADTFYPIRNAIPRNLRKGIFRGGRRRIDVFWRIHAGVPGALMPGLGGTSPGAEGTLSETDIWHIVDYVLSVEYEPISGPQEALPVNEGVISK